MHAAQPGKSNSLYALPSGQRTELPSVYVTQLVIGVHVMLQAEGAAKASAVPSPHVRQSEAEALEHVRHVLSQAAHMLGWALSSRKKPGAHALQACWSDAHVAQLDALQGGWQSLLLSMKYLALQRAHTAAWVEPAGQMVVASTEE